MAGSVGPAGSVGAAGVAGANGTAGATGSPGATGASGAQGAVGPAGPTGPSAIAVVTQVAGPVVTTGATATATCATGVAIGGGWTETDDKAVISSRLASATTWSVTLSDVIRKGRTLNAWVLCST